MAALNRAETEDLIRITGRVPATGRRPDGSLSPRGGRFDQTDDLDVAEVRTESPRDAVEVLETDPAAEISEPRTVLAEEAGHDVLGDPLEAGEVEPSAKSQRACQAAVHSDGHIGDVVECIRDIVESRAQNIVSATGMSGDGSSPLTPPANSESRLVTKSLRKLTNGASMGVELPGAPPMNAACGALVSPHRLLQRKSHPRTLCGASQLDRPLGALQGVLYAGFNFSTNGQVDGEEADRNSRADPDKRHQECTARKR